MRYLQEVSERTAAALGEDQVCFPSLLHLGTRRPPVRSPRCEAGAMSRWYVVQTQPHAEERAPQPRYKKERRHARRREVVRTPL